MDNLVSHHKLVPIHTAIAYPQPVCESKHETSNQSVPLTTASLLELESPSPSAACAPVATSVLPVPLATCATANRAGILNVVAPVSNHNLLFDEEKDRMARMAWSKMNIQRLHYASMMVTLGREDNEAVKKEVEQAHNMQAPFPSARDIAERANRVCETVTKALDTFYANIANKFAQSSSSSSSSATLAPADHSLCGRLEFVIDIRVLAASVARLTVICKKAEKKWQTKACVLPRARFVASFDRSDILLPLFIRPNGVAKHVSNALVATNSHHATQYLLRAKLDEVKQAGFNPGVHRPFLDACRELAEAVKVTVDQEMSDAKLRAAVMSSVTHKHTATTQPNATSVSQTSPPLAMENRNGFWKFFGGFHMRGPAFGFPYVPYHLLLDKTVLGNVIGKGARAHICPTHICTAAVTMYTVPPPPCRSFVYPRDLHLKIFCASLSRFVTPEPRSQVVLTDAAYLTNESRTEALLDEVFFLPASCLAVFLAYHFLTIL